MHIRCGACQREVYPGVLGHTDARIGRLIDALKDLEVLDATLIDVITGDNGASVEGTLKAPFALACPQIRSQAVASFTRRYLQTD